MNAEPNHAPIRIPDFGLKSESLYSLKAVKTGWFSRKMVSLSLKNASDSNIMKQNKVII
ncbi:hypothetical protein ACQ7CX_01150 [Chryseobacterium arthrosphaerae]|uniref:hypothetical protein n=1 Tax=Chryseobacterium arthrosphaerae TaxID=651561 RepID=UPI001BAEF254|nr:hypothetical protein [Chryseobacterium arthrosphaerae]QUY57880.1 hypothetical protein I2F65_11295 [Chryseobacterium arthrosphaerae]UEQ77744.1 hypothetical protein J8N07_05425 [Chryseobacterium arthrosphaerae]